MPVKAQSASDGCHESPAPDAAGDRIRPSRSVPMSSSGQNAASPGEITRLLIAWKSGDAGAINQLIPIVYGELHRMAERLLRNERPGHTLQPTAIVHEAY